MRNRISTASNTVGCCRRMTETKTTKTAKGQKLVRCSSRPNRYYIIGPCGAAKGNGHQTRKTTTSIPVTQRDICIIIVRSGKGGRIPRRAGQQWLKGRRLGVRRRYWLLQRDIITSSSRPRIIRWLSVAQPRTKIDDRRKYDMAPPSRTTYVVVVRSFDIYGANDTVVVVVGEYGAMKSSFTNH